MRIQLLRKKKPKYDINSAKSSLGTKSAKGNILLWTTVLHPLERASEMNDFLGTNTMDYTRQPV